MKQKGNLRPTERDKIAHMLATGKSIGHIARVLFRSKSTICDEIHRNRRWDEKRHG